MKAPKEIYVDEMGTTSIEPYDNLIQAKAPKMRQTKYLSEESVNKMIAEKDKEIIALKETILSQLNQAKIDSLNPQKDASKRGSEYRVGLCKAIDVVAYEFDALIHKQP